MPRKSDGLSEDQPTLKAGSRTYQLAQLNEGESHTESRVIPVHNLSTESIADTRRSLNSVYSTVVARAKKLGVDIRARTVTALCDDGDVVVTIVLTRS
jgi:hypothetical protein